MNLNFCNALYYLNSNANECMLCGSGSYSLPGWTHCLPCPHYAYCNYNKITIFPTYWRSNPETDIIYFCYVNPEVCTGNDETPCILGYKGPLCQACDVKKGYVLSQSKKCEKCNNLAKGTIIFLLMFLCFLFLEMYLLYTEIRNINEFSQNSSGDEYETIKEPAIFLDSFITHVQVLTLIQSFNFQYPQELNVISSFFVDTSSQFVYHQYCFLNLTDYWEDLVFINFWTIIACSLIRLLFLYLIWCLLLVHWLKKSKKSHYLTVFVIWGKIEFVTIIREWFLLNCEEVDNVFYILKDSNYACSLAYRENFLGITFPILSVIILSIPIFLFLFLGKHRNKLRNHDFIERFGSLFFGTRTGSFYWNAITFYYKVIFIVFMIFTQSNSIQIFGLYSLLLLYGLVSYILRPYRRKAQNQLNEWSVCIYLLTISFTLIKSVDSNNVVMGYIVDSTFSPETIDLLINISIYIMNIGFFIMLIFRILIQYSERVKTLYKSLKLRYYSYRHKRADKKRNRNFKPQSSEIIVDSLLLSSDQNINERNQNLFISTQGAEAVHKKAYRNFKSRGSYPPEILSALHKNKNPDSFDNYSQIQEPFINVSEISE